MIDGSLFDTIASGLMGGGAAVGVSILLLRRSVQELQERLEALEAENKECKQHMADKLDEGNRKFQTLEINILTGINELKLQISEIKGARNLAKDIVAEFAKLKFKQGDE